MPLWIIYHTDGTFDDDKSKQAFSEDITKMYTSIGLPAFFVVVNFIKLPLDSVYVGGTIKTDNLFVRIIISHIAIHQPDSDAAYERVSQRVLNTAKPHITDKGYDWEFHVEETERRLWKTNGLTAPPHNSEAEKLWVLKNKPVPWEA